MSSRWTCTCSLAMLALLACGTSETETGTDPNKPLADGQCRAEADCSDIESCVTPGTVTVCGGAGCPDNECNADFDCVNNGLGDICVTIEGIRLCRPGCSANNPCAAHEECVSSGHCEVKPCTADAECPANFACAPNVCRRLLCADDTPCDGYCVHGDCHAQPGTCEPPAA